MSDDKYKRFFFIFIKMNRIQYWKCSCTEPTMLRARTRRDSMQRSGDVVRTW